MTREKAEKACELLGQIERLEEFLKMDEYVAKPFLNEHNTGGGRLIVKPNQSLLIPNELLKDYVRQYLDYSKKEIVKLKDQLEAL